MVLSTNPIYFTFSLELVLIYILLFNIISNSHFVATAQLFIYLGAVNVLILFAVMFMNRSYYPKDFHLNLWTIGNGLTSLFCTIFFFFGLITIILNTLWCVIIWNVRANQIIKQDLISNSLQIGIHLATNFFLPFELILIILLFALIGAITVVHQQKIFITRNNNCKFYFFYMSSYSFPLNSFKV